jgi:hypothetical protein
MATSKNNVTYDNDTNRAIKNLTNQQFLDNNMNNMNNNYDNMNNNMNNNFRNNNYDNMNNNDNNLRYNSPNNNMPAENDLNQNFSRTSPPSQNLYNNNNSMNNNPNNNNNNNNNNFRTSMSSIGEKLIYNNSFNNNVVNKDVYRHPNTGFQNYYFNNQDSSAYDNIYSNKKINLINDYLSSKKQSQDEYITEQFGIKENSINNSNGRLNELMNKISDIRLENRFNQEHLYNKRNQYATLFDDKKLVEHNYKQQNLNNNKNNSITENDFQNYQLNRVINGKKSPQRLQHYTPFSNLGKVYTTVLPTSSQAYGSYFNNDDINRKDQSPNRIYY